MRLNISCWPLWIEWSQPPVARRRFSWAGWQLLSLCCRNWKSNRDALETRGTLARNILSVSLLLSNNKTAVLVQWHQVGQYSENQHQKHFITGTCCIYPKSVSGPGIQWWKVLPCSEVNWLEIATPCFQPSLVSPLSCSTQMFAELLCYTGRVPPKP